MSAEHAEPVAASSQRQALDTLSASDEGTPLLLRRGVVITIVVLFLALLVAYVVATRLYGVEIEIDAEPFRDWVDGFGRWGPLVFIAVMALSVLFAPIPNVPIFIAAGLAWGAVLGTVYSLAGLVIGSAIAFQCSRLLGRRHLAKLVGTRTATRLDAMSVSMGGTVVFWSRMLPGLNFDWVSFLAGMTSIGFRRFIIFSALGMVMPTFIGVAAGQGLGDDSRLTVAMAGLWVATVVASAAYFWWRRRHPSPSAPAAEPEEI